jgi:hypothetical protein
MENNNNQPSDNLFTGDALHTQPASLRGGLNYHNHEASNNDHHSPSNYHSEDTAPFNVTAFLNYLAERDNDFGAACQKYDDNTRNSNHNDDRSNNDHNRTTNDNDYF